MEWDKRNRSGLVNCSWLGFWIGEASCLQTTQSVEAQFLSSHISPTTNSATLLSKFSAQCQPTQLSTYKLQPVLILRPSLYRSFVANSKPSINSKFALKDNIELKHLPWNISVALHIFVPFCTSLFNLIWFVPPYFITLTTSSQRTLFFLLQNSQQCWDDQLRGLVHCCKKFIDTSIRSKHSNCWIGSFHSVDDHRSKTSQIINLLIQTYQKLANPEHITVKIRVGLQNNWFVFSHTQKYSCCVKPKVTDLDK